MSRALLLLLLPCLVATLAALSAPAGAQVPSQKAAEPTPGNPIALQKDEQKALPGDQKIERLQYEDSSARIDELRVGGQSQTITVRSRLPVPAWQVLGSEGAPGNGLNEVSAGKRPRVWNILNF